MARAVVTCLIIFVVVCGFFNVNGEEDVIRLNDANWKNILQDEWMIEFYAPWCPACSALQSVWKQYGQWGKDMGVKVAQIDVTESPGLSGRFMVTALPTIFHVHHGVFRQFKGSRDLEGLKLFIVQKKWKEVEPVPYWKKPDSIQMGLVSTFFKLSTLLRDFHNWLQEHWGLSPWGSYCIFALSTVLVGALLGLVLVLIVDILYPPRREAVRTEWVKREQLQKEKKAVKNSDDELGDEDIKDDLIDDAGDLNISNISSDSNSEKGSANNSPRKRTARLAD